MRSALFLTSLAIASLGFAQAPSQKISLAEALRLAHQNSPVLAGSTSDAEAANSASKVAKARLMPVISANGFATTGNNPGVMSSSPMVEPPAWMLIPAGGFLDGNLSLMLPIFAPRLRGMASAASWQARAAAGDLAEARGDLDLQVTEAYSRVLLARQMVLTEGAKVAATKELVRTSQALFEAGKGIEASVLRTQAELSRAQRALTSAQNDEEKAGLDLQATMGADFAIPLDPSDDLKNVNPLSDLPTYRSRAHSARGMVLAAHARQEAASADARAANGQHAPSLYGVVMSDATNSPGMGGITAGLTLSFPIFDGGRINAEVSQAKSMKSKADSSLRLAELTVEKEVRQAWLDVQTARANAASAEASVKAAQSAYDVTALRVTAGKSILVEQLDALESLVRAKADLAQATFDHVIAVARLTRASGAQL